jgi:hypothetical protein
MFCNSPLVENILWLRKNMEQNQHLKETTN